MYVDVPPVNDAVQLTVCPTSSFADDGQFDNVGVAGAPEITVRVPVFTLFDVDDTDEYVASTFALSCEQVFPDGPVYHLTV